LLDLVEVQVKYTLRLRYRRYTGGMSRNQRDEAVRDFSENPATRVMLVSLRAGNAGLNLTAASRVIICDPFWNPYIEMQAVDRAHRIGQAREVRVHRVLVGGTVEDRIVELQESKRRLVDAALDEGQSKSLGRLSEQELAYLFGVSPPPPAQEDAAAGSAANAAAGSTAGATAGRAGRS
jgi:SNF2 family DNA or RNA helicase